MMTLRIVLAAAFITQSCDSQPTDLALSPAHGAIIQSERLAVVGQVRELPLTVQQALRTAFAESSLQMTDPHAASGRIPWRRSRRLILAGCGPDHCLLQYADSGFGGSYRVVVFGLNRDNAQVEWSGAVPRRLNGLAELKAVVQQTATRPDGKR